MNAKKHTLSTDDLRRGRETVEKELQDARADYAKAAYAAAVDRNDDAARKVLIEQKQRMDLLAAELQGLAAATGEAERRETAEALEARLAATEARRTEALAAADAVGPAFAKVAEAVKVLGAAWDECKQAQQLANRMEGESAFNPRGNVEIYRPKHDCKPLLEALLWLQFRADYLELTRSDAVMDSGGREFPDRPAEIIAKRTDSARRAINSGIDRDAQDLRERLQAVAA